MEAKKLGIVETYQNPWLAQCQHAGKYIWGAIISACGWYVINSMSTPRGFQADL